MKHLTILIFFLFPCISLIADDINVEVTHPLQSNDCIDGFIDLQITGGYAPYDIKYEKLFEHDVFGLFWITVKEVQDVSGSNGEEDLEDAMEGRYRITIVDFHCAEVVTGAELECECVACDIQSMVTSPSCLGDDGGSISIEMSCENEGHQPFQAKWGDGGEGLSRTGLTPGRYCVTVQDRNECEASQCWILSIENSFQVDLIEKVNPTFCGGNCDGSLGVNVTGGVTPYQITWSNGYNGSTYNNLCAGTHNVTVNDRTGCSIVKSFDLCCCEPGEGGGPFSDDMCSLDGLELDFSVGSLPKGFINTSISGGSGDMACSWSGPSGFTNHGCSGISNINEEGEYTFSVTDGCNRLSKTFPVIDCGEITVAIEGVTTNTCPDFNAGTIALNVSGGNSPYFYAWSTGQKTSEIDRLFAGEYCVTVTDRTFCSAISCFTIEDSNEPSAPMATSTPCQTIVACNGVPITIDAAEYIYSPSNGLCVFNRYCPATNTSVPVPFFPSTIVSTIGCTRMHLCANGLPDTEFGTPISGGTSAVGVDADPSLNCPDDLGCTTGTACELTSGAGIPETVATTGSTVTCATKTSYGKDTPEADERCQPGQAVEIYYCGSNEVDFTCLDIARPAPVGSSIAAIEALERSNQPENFIKNKTEKFNSKNVSIYPNPIGLSEILNVDINNSAGFESVMFDIFDLLGNPLISDKIELVKHKITENEISLQGLNPGLYIIEIKNQGLLLHSQKFVIN